MAHNDMDILCDFYDNVIDTMADVNTKLKSGDGKIRPADADFVEKLTKSAQNLTTTMAMIEQSEMDNYSQDYRGSMRSRDDRSMMNGTSRARGRMNAPRDSRGRYSGNYSREDEMRDMADNIRDRMRDMPEDMRRSAEDFVSRLERKM